MSDATTLLSRIQSGDRKASDELLPLVYQELRRLAQARLAAEPSGLTLQPTALVHEAYVRLVDTEVPPEWNGRGHFFAAAAEAMRRILVEHARRRRCQKRGGDRKKVQWDSVHEVAVTDPDHLIALNDAVDLLSEQHQRAAELVKLRFFAGMTATDAAASLGISRATADRTWAYARAWLFRQLSQE